MANRFKDPMLKDMYDGCIKHYDRRGGDFFAKDGSQKKGSTLATFFWRGYNGVPQNWDAASKRAPIYACYRAGQDIKKREGK